nr:hypothetical protein [Allomuricauda sp.]
MKLNKRNKYLIGGILAMFLVCYFLAVKNTLALKSQLLASQKQHGVHMNINQQVSQLAIKEQRLDLELSSLHLDDTSMQNNLLRVLNKKSEDNGLKIIVFNAPHIVQDNNTELKTQIFTLEGSYSSILKVLYELESKGSFGRITHVNFEKQRDLRSRVSSLQATVYLEVIN